MEKLGLLEKVFKGDFAVVVVRKVAIMHEINILWKVSSWKGQGLLGQGFEEKVLLLL